MLRVIPFPPPRTMFNNNSNISTGYSQFSFRQESYSCPHLPDQIYPTPQAISQIFKRCTSLFITRRLPEALAEVQCVVTDPSASIRNCPRALRVKFWQLYLAILDAVAKTGACEGKATWGLKEWQQLMGKIRLGTVWEEIINSYGDEGRVDPEVVVSLATLLLTHSPDQSITQQKLEAHLGALPSVLSPAEDPHSSLQRSHITEIYVLHVLPRVGQWEYAREFTQMSPDIDEDQREQFYRNLELQEKDMLQVQLHSQKLEKQREEDLEFERSNAPEIREAKSSYVPSVSSRTPSRRRGSSVKPSDRLTTTQENASANEATVKKRLSATKETKKTTATVVSQSTETKNGKSSLVTSTTAMLSRMQKYMATHGTPFSMLHTIVMLMVIAWMTNNKRMRERVRGFLTLCWIKIGRTVGMGMKITYI
ncbi:hypothetical protein K440DRAFT_591510, partial [Wilcoxina mikolae CBS 423.85]